MHIEFRLDAKGIGDAVCGVYAACGLANRGHTVVFYSQHWEYLQSFKNMNLTIRGNDPSVFDANARYMDQLEAARTKTCRSRASWYLRNIQEKWTTIRNEVKPALPHELLPAGKVADLDSPYIVLAPFSAYRNREWSTQHWRLLAKVLMDEGYQVIAMGAHTDANRLKEAFSKTGVRYFWGHSPSWVINTIRGSLLVIGNDSGPAHLAGLHQHPAIALCGQIDGDFLYRDSPSVHPMMPSAAVKCRMCHWKQAGGYHWICDNECSALQLISPFEVVDKALSIIKGNTDESIRREAGGREADLPGAGVPGVQQADQSSSGERQEESSPGQEGGRSEAGEFWTPEIPRLYPAQEPGAPGELPKEVSRHPRQERKTDKGRRIQRELLGA